MKKAVLIGCLALSANAFSQTVLFQDDFESMININWLMNGGNGENRWIINAVYAGGGSVPASPNQPGTFNGGTNSSYLHVYNYPNCNGFVPVTCNANFDPIFTSDQWAEMQAGVSTSGMSGISINFWYTCAGEAGVSYGTVEYSIDNGTNWNQAGAQLSGVSTWTQLSITDPAFDNQADLRFRFRWQNGASGMNPPFSIDELTIISPTSPSETITMQHLNSSEYCAGVTDIVGFEALGTYTAGNIFTAQLSDASGSFASPSDIGTLASTSSGIQSINVTYPSGIPDGTGYRVRVISSAPAVTGGDNGENVTFHALPTINVTATPADGIMCEGESVLMNATGAVDYFWSPSDSIDNPNVGIVTANPSQTTTYIVSGNDIHGCMDTAAFVVTVEDCAGIGEAKATLFSLFPNPASDVLEIRFNTTVDVQSIQLLDETGRVIRKLKASQQTIAIDDLKAGSYFVRVVHNGGSETVRLTRH